MSLTPNPGQQPYPPGDQSAYDVEPVVFGAADYSPKDKNGVAQVARGFVILGTTGTVKIDTPAGQQGVVIPSGLATGVAVPIAFTKLYSASGATTFLALI